MDGGKGRRGVPQQRNQVREAFYTRRRGLFLGCIVHIPRPWIPGP